VEHIAIDLGGKESQICVRDGTGAIVEERRCPTAELDAFLAGRAPARVIVETCAEAFRIADIARAVGHEPRVVAATLVRSLGVGARRTKYDRRDARVLSEVSTRIDVPSVHIPAATSRQRKSMCATRESLVRARTQVTNCVHGWLRMQGIRLAAGNVVNFTRRVRAHVSSRPAHIERLLELLDELHTRICQANTELRRLAKQDPVCRRLMTAPGVGSTTAIRFVATLDDVTRFPDAHQVASYLGLVPGERSSGAVQRRTGITKAGSPALRHCLVQAAWATKRMRVHGPLQHWGARIARRHGKQVAAVAVARKLSGILYALWRDGTTYDPGRAAKPPVLPMPRT
jgi:transposase